MSSASSSGSAPTLAQRIKDAASRNEELLAILSETDNTLPALEQQNRLIADLEHHLTQSTGRKRKLETQRQSELKDHEKYRDSIARRFLHKAVGKSEKFESKAAKEEREYMEATQALYREETTNDDIKSQLEEANKVKQQLEADAFRRGQAQSGLDHLYTDIFGGPTPEFPEEDARERESEAALNDFHELRSKLEVEQQVAKLITEAHNKLRYALDKMESALSHSRSDMYGSNWGDTMKRNSLHKAETSCMQANMLVTRAQQLNADVQDLPDVHFDQGDIVMDVFFDNIFTDMEFHDKIKNSQVLVRRCEAAVKRNGQECLVRQQSIQDALEGKKKRLDETRMALQKERERVFSQVVNGGAEQDSEISKEAPLPAGEKPPAYDGLL